MPTFVRTAEFNRDLARLSPAQRRRFRAAVRELIEDLRGGQFRKGLRVKRFQRRRGVWEMSWDSDGRALFEYGSQVHPGEHHIVWLRVGGHEIFEQR